MNDDGGAGRAHPACVFVMSGPSSPQLPLRWLGLFAGRDLLPLVVDLRRSEQGIAMRIEQDGLDDWTATVILEKIRAIPETSAVALEVDVDTAPCDQPD